MANIAVALKNEITRLVRKEVRQDMDDMKKALRAQRADNSALKKQVAEMQRALSKLAGQVSTSAKASQHPAVQVLDSGASSAAPSNIALYRASFSADGFAKLRKSWKLSAEAMGTLVGASGQSVYKWEQKGVVPRDKQLIQIWAVKDLTREQALARLAKMQG